MRRSILIVVGARAIRSLTAARANRGRFPAREQNSEFLGPEPRGKDARKWHIRDKRKLSGRLREFFLYSPAIGRTVGVRVLLPGVPQETSPVIHLYHGGGDDFRSWTDLGAAEELTQHSPYLVVMPDAGAGTYSRLAVGSQVHDWPKFHTEEIPQFLKKNFSVDFAPENQLVAGLSMGGYGAMKYAAWHPDKYGAAAAFSSPLDPLAAVPAFDIIAMREGARSSTLFGDPTTDRSEWLANSPVHLAENLRDLHLWFSAGSGSQDQSNSSSNKDLLETMVNRHGERFSARLNSLGIAHSWFPRSTGLHDWSTWQRELGAWLGTLARHRNYGSSPVHTRRGDRSVTAVRTAIADGGEFSHLTGHPLFEVFGWRVEISRRRAQIVRFGEVSAAGFSLTGTGSFRVRTPDFYRPGSKYDIAVTGPSGTNEYSQRADKSGRLTFTGRLAAALHDPIIPGRRTGHFTTQGQEDVTSVTIMAAEPDPADRARTAADDDVSISAHVDEWKSEINKYSCIGHQNVATNTVTPRGQS